MGKKRKKRRVNKPLAAAPPAQAPSEPRAFGRSRMAETPYSADIPENAGKWRTFGKPRSWDIEAMDHTKMVRMAIHAYQKFGIARGAVRMITGFTVGSQPIRPVVESADEAIRKQVQALVDFVWCDPVNDLPKKLSTLSNGLAVTGSLAVTLDVQQDAEGEGSRITRLAYIDTSAISEVLVDPGNVLSPVAVIRSSASFGMNDYPVLHPIVRKDQSVHAIFAGRTIGSKMKLPRTGTMSSDVDVEIGLPCKYLGINRVPGQSMGLSDIYAAVDVLQLHDESLFSAGERGSNLAAFAWWAKFPQGTPAKEIEKQAENLRRDIESGAGRLVATTEDVSITAVAPALQAAEWATHENMLRTNVLIALGPLPLHWFTDGGKTNLATAGEQGSPVMNFLLDRQTQVEEFWLDVIDFSLMQFPEVEALLERDPEAYKVTLPLPVLAGKDQSREVDIATKEQQILSAYESGGVLTVEAHQRLARESLNKYGFKVTEDDMQDAEDVRGQRMLPFSGQAFPPAEDEEEEDEDGVRPTANLQESGERQATAA